MHLYRKDETTTKVEILAWTFYRCEWCVEEFNRVGIVKKTNSVHWSLSRYNTGVKGENICHN